MATTRQTFRLPAAWPTLLVLLFSATSASAGTDGFIAIPDIPELKDRVRVFRQALREVTVDPEPAAAPAALSSDDVLSLECRHRFLQSLGRPDLDEHPGMPGRRDLVFEEQWLLAGREEDHEDAARHWLGRHLKGSERRVKDGRSPIKAKVSWDHGPLLGIGHGPVSLRAGGSQWRLQWSTRWARSGGPWRSRAAIGEEDGDFKVEFMIGRSLLDSYGR